MPMFGGRKIVRTATSRRINGAAPARPARDGPPLAGVLIVEAGNLSPDDGLRASCSRSRRRPRPSPAMPTRPNRPRSHGPRGARRHGLKITPDARELLVARLGADRALSRGEVEKLALYAAGKGTIDVDDVEAIVGDASELAMDRIVDAAAAGDAARAVSGCQRADRRRRRRAIGHRGGRSATSTACTASRAAIDAGPLPRRRAAPDAPAAAFPSAGRLRGPVPALDRARNWRRRWRRHPRQARSPPAAAPRLEDALAERLLLELARIAGSAGGAGRGPRATRDNRASRLAARPPVGDSPPHAAGRDTMAEIAYDVVGIGNAIVDIIGRCNEDSSSRHGARQGRT